MNHIKQVEFVDGPQAGEAHEVEAGFPVPDRLAVVRMSKVGSQSFKLRDWYRVEDGKGYYTGETDSYNPDRMLWHRIPS